MNIAGIASWGTISATFRRKPSWHAYRTSDLPGYPDDRDRPDLDRTSRMSVYLKWGCIHPRTMLADLGAGAETFRRQIAWRDFYASVLAAWPASAREYFLPAMASMTLRMS